MIALAVAQPSLSKSASNSTFVVAAASESTKIVTNLSLSDSLTLVTISSIASKISSTVSTNQLSETSKVSNTADAFDDLFNS